MDRASPTGFQRASCIAWWWGGWDSNPRPRDYEVSQGPSLTCMIIGDLLSELRFHRRRPLAVDGPKRPLCGHGVGTAGTHTRHGYRGSRISAEAVGRSGGVLPAGLAPRFRDAYTGPRLSR